MYDWRVWILKVRSGQEDSVGFLSGNSLFLETLEAGGAVKKLSLTVVAASSIRTTIFSWVLGVEGGELVPG